MPACGTVNAGLAAVALLAATALLGIGCAAPLGDRGGLASEAGPPQRPIVRDVVILGRSQGRMNQVRRLLADIEHVRLHSTFSEREALEVIDTVPNLGVVLLGGATSNATRRRIRAHLAQHHPGVTTSEPGRQYRYSDANILNDVRTKIERGIR